MKTNYSGFCEHEEESGMTCEHCLVIEETLKPFLIIERDLYTPAPEKVDGAPLAIVMAANANEALNKFLKVRTDLTMQDCRVSWQQVIQ